MHGRGEAAAASNRETAQHTPMAYNDMRLGSCRGSGWWWAWWRPRWWRCSCCLQRCTNSLINYYPNHWKIVGMVTAALVALQLVLAALYKLP